VDIIVTRNRSTRKKPTPVRLCPPQIPQDMARARTGTTAVGMATSRLSYGKTEVPSMVWVGKPAELQAPSVQQDPTWTKPGSHKTLKIDYSKFLMIMQQSTSLSDDIIG
jgi:hypothetical protein